MDPSRTAMRASVAIARGATRGELRGPQWVQVGHGLVKPAGLVEDATWARISAATGLMTDGCSLGGWASLRAQGNHWFDGRVGMSDRPALIHCRPGARIRRRDGVQTFRGLLFPDEVIHLDDLEVTTMARAAFDEMRMASNVRDAVVALDMATSTTAQVPHTTLARVEQVILSHHKVRGLVQARHALLLGSSRSASPLESRTRLLAELDVGITHLGGQRPSLRPIRASPRCG